jgi:hypothetical protein
MLKLSDDETPIVIYGPAAPLPIEELNYERA